MPRPCWPERPAGGVRRPATARPCPAGTARVTSPRPGDHRAAVARRPTAAHPVRGDGRRRVRARPTRRGARHLPSMPTTRIYFDAAEATPVLHRGGHRPAAGELPHGRVAGFLRRDADQHRCLPRAGPRLPCRVRPRHRSLGDRERGQRRLDRSYPVRGGETDHRVPRGLGAGPTAGAHPLRQCRLRGRARRAGPAGLLPPLRPTGRPCGLRYVFLSYYEDSCGGTRPSVAAWTGSFRPCMPSTRTPGSGSARSA